MMPRPRSWLSCWSMCASVPASSSSSNLPIMCAASLPKSASCWRTAPMGRAGVVPDTGECRVAGRPLGIDPSLDRTGYAIVENDARRVVEAGVLRTARNVSLPSRLVELAVALDEVLDEHVVQRVAVEDL